MELLDSLDKKLEMLTVKERRAEAMYVAIRDERVALESALQTLRRYADVPAASVPAHPVERVVAVNGHKPSMPDMVIAALKADETGLGWLPHQVVEFIHQRFDPKADPNHIRPSLWRLQQKGKIGKTDERYHLLPSEALQPTHGDFFNGVKVEASM